MDMISLSKWDGEQPIPEAFITKETNRIITNGDYKVYGGGKEISNQGVWLFVVDCRYGGVDLYISFREQDGSLGGAISFGDKINTERPDSGGYVWPNGNYLFFK
jgi:hypothetical protein